MLLLSDQFSELKGFTLPPLKAFSLPPLKAFPPSSGGVALSLLSPLLPCFFLPFFLSFFLFFFSSHQVNHQVNRYSLLMMIIIKKREEKRKREKSRGKEEDERVRSWFWWYYLHRNHDDWNERSDMGRVDQMRRRRKRLVQESIQYVLSYIFELRSLFVEELLLTRFFFRIATLHFFSPLFSSGFISYLATIPLFAK